MTFERNYFEEGTTGYRQYRDFPVHYVTASKIQERNPKSVLEVGGARGYICKILQTHGVPSVCMDVSVYCNQNKVVEEFVLHDATKEPYPFKDKEFDLCVSVAVLEHLPEDRIDAVISEMIRVSNRGLHGITFEKTTQDRDTTHCNMHPREWWVDRFSRVDSDYAVEIVDKEELEQGAVDIAKYAPSDGMVKLNIGSFTDMFHYGWVNVDILDLGDFARNNGYLFQKLDVLNAQIEYDKFNQNVQLAKKIRELPFANDSVDVVLSSHMLEHFSREEGIDFLKDCKRILKNGGVIRIGVPDARYISALYVGKSIGGLTDYAVEVARDESEAFYKILMDGHRTVYDEESLVKALTEAGFLDVKKVGAFSSRSDEIKKQTISTHPSISLYVEGSVVKKPVAVKEVKTYNAVRNGKLKVALVSTPMIEVPPKAYGGLELIVHDLGVGLAKLGHEVTIFAPNGSYAEGCAIVETGMAMNTVQCDWVEAERGMFKRYVDRLGEFDITHGHNWFGFEYLAKASKPELKICHTHHGHLNMEWWGRSRPPFKTNLIGISDWMVSAYAKQGFAARRVYNGVDVTKYKMKEKKGDRLLFVGRFDEFKRPHIALEVAHKLGVGIDLVGGSFVQNTNYLAMVKAQDGDNGVKVWVDASNEDKIRLYQNARCTIVPSKMGEPFGLIAPESMLCGTPVVASNDGALIETVKEGGVVCMDVDAMVDAIKFTIPNITAKACRKNGERFSTENMATEYLKRYREILANDEW